MILNYGWKAISGQNNYLGIVTSYKMSENEMGNRGSKSEYFLSTQQSSTRYSIAVEGFASLAPMQERKVKKYFSVKEQRVYGSYSGLINNSKLRFTLMGGESRYQIKIPSKQLNISLFSTLNGYETLSNNNNKLDPWFITGFSDAESSFSITISPDNRAKLKWAIQAVFAINLHKKDVSILEGIKNTLGVGRIYFINDSVVTYRVKNKKELQTIIDHFDKYPLVTAKHSDYLLFKQSFEIMKTGEHLNTAGAEREEGLSKILALKSSLNFGLSEKLMKAFPNIIPISRPEFIFRGIPNPFWVSGFVSGDGSFYLIAKKIKSKLIDEGAVPGAHTPLAQEKTYMKVTLNFKICLHLREEEVIKGLLNYLILAPASQFKSSDNFSYEYNEPSLDSITQEGNNNQISETDLTSAFSKTKENKSKLIYKTENTVTLHITRFSDIINIIIPFFEKYTILGMKSLDFADFKEASQIVKNKEHLTSEGFNSIVNINSNMNQRR